MQFRQHLIEFIGNHYLLTSAFLIVLALLLFTEGRKSGKAVSTGEATTLINRENAVVVDLRPKKDFSAGHIVDSLNIPYESLTSRMGELDKHKGKPLLLVCAALCVLGEWCDAGGIVAPCERDSGRWKGRRFQGAKWEY